MKTNVKIVMAGINVVCLLVTLLYPNSVTSISLLPVIVTVTSWVFLPKNDYLSNEVRKRYREYLVFSTMLAVFCVTIGITGRVQRATTTNCSRYTICFPDETLLIGGKSFDYFWFALAAFIAILCLIVAEVVAAHKGELQQQVKQSKSMHDMVAEVIRQVASNK